jgi:hypothetical protein
MHTLIKLNRRFWEELMIYFPLLKHGQHRKGHVQQYCYCKCIRCCYNTFTKPLSMADMGYICEQTDEKDL